LFEEKGPRYAFKSKGDDANGEKHKEWRRQEEDYTAAVEIAHLVEPRMFAGDGLVYGISLYKGP
jgi:hypothetical protein